MSDMAIFQQLRPGSWHIFAGEDTFGHKRFGGVIRLCVGTGYLLELSSGPPGLLVSRLSATLLLWQPPQPHRLPEEAVRSV